MSLRRPSTTQFPPATPAFDAFFTTNFDGLSRTVAATLRMRSDSSDTAEADDIAQRTMIAAWERAVDVGAPTAVAWITKRAGWLVSDLYKTSAHRQRVVAIDCDGGTAYDFDDLLSSYDGEQAAEREADEQRREWVAEMLSLVRVALQDDAALLRALALLDADTSAKRSTTDTQWLCRLYVRIRKALGLPRPPKRLKATAARTTTKAPKAPRRSARHVPRR